MDYPPVIVLIITYKRLPLALATVRSVKQFVDYPNIGFHIADDGSGQEHMARLHQEIGGSYNITVSDAAREGVGKSMNLGIEACLKRANLWLHLEDDWVLRQSLDLKPCVRLLEENPDIGLVRLGRLAANLKGQTFSAADNLWWRLEKNCDTYVFNGNASLRHRRFHESYGKYREGLMPGQTELSYCGKFNGIQGPGIVWPAWLSCEQTFEHIGDHQSYKWWLESGGLTPEQAALKFDEMDKVTA